jgi:hypothetical protein
MQTDRQTDIHADGQTDIHADGLTAFPCKLSFHSLYAKNEQISVNRITDKIHDITTRCRAAV